jgi:hypothetical protein
VRAVSGVDLDPGMPFLRSVVDHAPTLRRGLLCPAPRTRVVAFLPIASDASMPSAGYSPQVPVRVVAGFHGEGWDEALRYLVTGTLPRAPAGIGTLNRVIRAGATAWMVPELPIGLNPKWQSPATDAHDCPRTGWPQPTR